MMGEKSEMKVFRCTRCQTIYLVARIKDAERIEHKCYRCKRLKVFRIENYKEVPMEVELAEATAL
ncbi:hypothetical protein LCGC14_2228530 [marine sediment metagenome]|uniref:Uncharacterized protein n=1 Tax=marine sediment metagenome TaxID=412755 RepID=A0A0F9DWJ4_9ZZZZ